ncbi:LLM class flavin-dependent oxidoreductase [Clostridium paraputrificum]|uniref:LLM class flavin-dependent oxidoreductase n=1 Tax=Clostridium paraputrificum TaxID=29363 RepID=UPI003D32A717
MKLSVLDQGIISKGNSAIDTLNNSIELAKFADELGYHRIWYSEHHSSEGLACTAPEILVAHIASVTKNIRVGTGGVMLMHYSPYKVAEVFNMLSTLNLNRIDIGIGRAPGGDYASMVALAQGKNPEMHNLYSKISETLMYMSNTHSNKNTFAGPIGSPLPEAWMLGSSGNSAVQAGKLGLGYSYAHFIGSTLEEAVFDDYRRSFIPSEFVQKPQINIGYSVVASETKDEAEFEAASLDLMFLNIVKGISGSLLSPEEALSYSYSEMDKMRIKDNRNRMLVGSSKEIADILRSNEEKYGIDEAMIVGVNYSMEAKLRTYKLLAKELL